MYLVPINLFSRSSKELLDSVASLASAELVALAGRLTRIFSIASPFSPGLHCVGGEIAIDADPIAASGATRLSVAGNGETLAAALVSCLGEAADFLSQFERPGDIEAGMAGSDRTNFVADGWIADPASFPGAGGVPSTAWITPSRYAKPLRARLAFARASAGASDRQAPR